MKCVYCGKKQNKHAIERYGVFCTQRCGTFFANNSYKAGYRIVSKKYDPNKYDYLKEE